MSRKVISDFFDSNGENIGNLTLVGHASDEVYMPKMKHLETVRTNILVKKGDLLTVTTKVKLDDAGNIQSSAISSVQLIGADPSDNVSIEY